jgi:CheY-like chemotaxis protein
MFVDDDADTLEMFKKCVELFGHQAVLAHSPDEALQFAEKQDLDVVFVDLYLCEANGLELIGRMRKILKTTRTKVYVLSAGSEHEVAGKLEPAGANAFLQKPVRLQSLLNTISLSNAQPGSALALGGIV